MKRSEIAATVSYFTYALGILMHVSTGEVSYGVLLSALFFMLAAIYQKSGENVQP